MKDLKEELFNKLDDHIQKDAKPSEYLNKIYENKIFQKEFPFTLLSRLKNIEQSPKHHPEGNVWNHTLQVLDNAAQVKSKSSEPRVFMWAALLHDIGKATTTRLRKGRITSYDHDKEGERLAREFLECFTRDEEFISKVCAMVRWHMQILFVTNKLPFADLKTMKKQADIREIALLGFCDRLGRSNHEDVDKEAEIMDNFIRICERE